MKEQFVTYEIALKLKELGFDEYCFGYFTKLKYWMIKDHKGNPSPWLKYNVGDHMYLKTVVDSFGDNLHRNGFTKNSKYTKATTNVAAPLWQQAQEYLRNIHDIHITIDSNSAGWFYRLWTNDNTKLIIKEGAFPEYSFSKPEYNSHESSLKKAIEKSLKLIENV